MSPEAIVLMIISLGLIWGGLIVLIVRLRYSKVDEDVIEAYNDELAMEKLRTERQAVLEKVQ